MKILVINGPNLQLLGTREPGVYGESTLAEIAALLERTAAELGAEVVCRQSNHEGELVDWIGSAAEAYAGLIINPAAYTHSSIAIRDAIAASGLPAVEVHLRNVHARPELPQRSLTAPVCIGQISGFRLNSYVLALRALTAYLK